jgi:hypothetical protein
MFVTCQWLAFHVKQIGRAKLHNQMISVEKQRFVLKKCNELVMLLLHVELIMI